jgi:hypothetical protein
MHHEEQQKYQLRGMIFWPEGRVIRSSMEGRKIHLLVPSTPDGTQGFLHGLKAVSGIVLYRCGS